MKANNKKRKNTILKTIGFSLLFASVATAAIVLPIELNKDKKYSLSLNNSTDTYEGNKNRINNFINENFSKSSYELNGSLKVFGKDGVIGQTDVELSSSQRSLITVIEAYKNNLFTFKLSSFFNTQASKNKIKYKLEYVKPYYTDSTYPVVGIKFYYGSGASYYETIFEYRDTDLYGFKKAPQQTMLDSIAQDIIKNPNDYFQLKTEIGKVGDLGLYASEIKKENFNLNSPKIKELREKNYWVSIASTSVDTTNPTMLKLNFSISYNDGIVTNYLSDQFAYIGPFDIQQGIDDPESKLNRFLDENEEWINSLYQYVTYTKPEGDETIYSARQAYEKGFIKFEPTYSIRSKLESYGIAISFKTFEEEQEIIKTNPQELTVSNYEFDSTTPTYRLYFSSYVGTPLEFTKSILIEGISQEGDFLVSQEEKNMKAFDDYLFSATLGFEDIYDFDYSSNNPISLSDFFMNKNVTFTSNKYNIPFDLIFKQYTLYNEALNPEAQNIEKPFKNFKLIMKKNLQLPTSYSYEGQTYNIQEIAQNVLDTFNNPQNGDFDVQLDSLSNNSDSVESTINLNMYLGSFEQGTMYTNVVPLTIYLSDYFETNNNYVSKQLEEVKKQISSQNVSIKMNVKNEAQLIQNIQTRNWDSIFEGSVQVYNIKPGTIQFPELQSQLKFEVDKTFFNIFDKAQLDAFIQTKTIQIQIKISIDNVTESVVITKTFDELLK